MVSPLKPEARREADKNHVEYDSTDAPLFRVHRTISALTVAIHATAVRRHRVRPSRRTTKEAVCLGAVRSTGAGATPAVKLVFRLDATKTSSPPAPTADVF